MNIKKIITTSCLAAFALIFSLQVIAGSFVVRKIQIIGLQRISRGTVLNYLPVRVGQTLRTKQSANILTALYDTGFFSDIEVDRRGHTLIIKVSERPTIGNISIKGNKSIPKKQLTKVMKGIGIAQGLVFNQSTLDDVKRSLVRQYYDHGNYNATVDTTVIPQPENRVNIKINISEGPTAKIKEIRIIGNQSFKTRELLKQFKLSKTNLLSVFYKDDQYSREKLNGDLESLKSFYQNHGYIKFRINSSHVTLTPDKRKVYIVIDITEGAQYKISGYKIAGTLIRPRQALDKLIFIKQGEVFDRARITASTMAIGNDLGNYGYIYAKVEPIPDVNDHTKTVFVTFLITPNNRYYVRHVTFTGNTKTLDHVLRNAVRQQEAALASLKDIQNSEHNLNLFGFVKGVTVNNEKVAGKDDLVDVNFKVTEKPTATLTAGAGWSDSEGFLVNLGYTQPNFMGTGRSVSASAGRTKYQTSFSFGYFNPYYTESGIGRGFSIYANSVNAAKMDNSKYITEDYGVNMNFSIPIAEYRSFNTGVGYQMTYVTLGGGAADELLNFYNGSNFNVPFAESLRNQLLARYEKKTRKYRNVVFNAGISMGSFDRAMFPTRGFRHSIDANVAVPGGGRRLEYYTTDYMAHWYHPLFKGFILSFKADLGYGASFGDSKEFPFFRNYNAGGIGVQGAVRGYESFTLGPKDSNDDSLGGNFLAAGSLGIILPQPISGNSFRTSAFFDFGNVYNTTGVNVTTGAGYMRFSYGVAVDWQSPMGPLEFSLAKAINPRKSSTLLRNGTPVMRDGDNTQAFQFTVATAF